VNYCLPVFDKFTTILKDGKTATVSSVDDTFQADSAKFIVPKVGEFSLG